jgi:hypothetical protein
MNIIRLEVCIYLMVFNGFMTNETAQQLRAELSLLLLTGRK